MKFYLKLALGNIKKNKKLYSSYFISTIFSIALYFIIKTVGNSPTLKGQDSITMFLNLGGYVIALFSLIFLFYTNSFVIKNRKKEISLYGLDANVNQISHFADITLNQNVVNLTDDTIIVDNKFKPTLVPQLEKLGILAEKIKMCIIDNVFYPIYKINFSKINSQRYYETELLAA